MYNMSNKEIMKPSDDIVFKRLFGKKGNERLIKDLLEGILEIEIEKVELGKEVEIIPERIEEKLRNTGCKSKLGKWNGNRCGNAECKSKEYSKENDILFITIICKWNRKRRRV